jgi:cytochrome c oxidase assembly protein subunit 15
VNYSATRGYYKLCLSTLVAVYFLILVGGVVRTTGSGMGCPDWPRCFGQWVPPTSITQLPVDYKDQYATLRDNKNQKFARYLSAVGMNETAKKILNDKSILVESDFNAQKTWIEYLNRLVGVVIGFLIIAVFIRSIPLRKTNPFFFWLSLATLLAVIIQGWFGSIVVSTNLTSWTITIHMLLALVIVAMLILLMHRAAIHQVIFVPTQVKVLLGICMLLLLVQILLGTEVRSAIDRVAELKEGRGKWISLIWTDFIVHRSFSWVVLVLHAIFIFRLKKTTGNNTLSLRLVLLILLTILTGAGMGYFSVPAFLQPIHLLVATATFGFQFLLFLRLNTHNGIVLVNLV